MGLEKSEEEMEGKEVTEDGDQIRPRPRRPWTSSCVWADLGVIQMCRHVGSVILAPGNSASEIGRAHV